MGTLRKVKNKMKRDKELRRTLIRSAKDEILIDIDGDGLPDIALMDSTGDGNIDTLAVNLMDDDEFNLYFHDSDGNNLPDMILLDSEGDGNVEVLAVGPEVEARMIMAAHAIFAMMDLGDYIAEKLDQSFDELQDSLENARKILKKM